MKIQFTVTTHPHSETATLHTFATKSSAQSFFDWAAEQSFYQAVRMYRGEAGGELLQSTALEVAA